MGASDLVITVGGVSAGERDLLPGVWQRLGLRTLVHGVAMQPGKPLLAATDGGRIVLGLPGNPVSAQLEPVRSERKYRKFNGDGPAKMMAKFRNWEASQLLAREDPAADFDAVVDEVAAALTAGKVLDAEEPEGWEIVARSGRSPSF